VKTGGGFWFWKNTGVENPRVGGSNLPPGTIISKNPQQRRWCFFVSEGLLCRVLP